MKHAPLSPWGVKTQLVVGNVRVLAADGVLGLGERRLSIHLCKKRHVGQLDDGKSRAEVTTHAAEAAACKTTTSVATPYHCATSSTVALVDPSLQEEPQQGQLDGSKLRAKVTTHAAAEAACKTTTSAAKPYRCATSSTVALVDPSLQEEARQRQFDDSKPRAEVTTHAAAEAACKTTTSATCSCNPVPLCCLFS